jgi:hypothetical protein
MVHIRHEILTVRHQVLTSQFSGLARELKKTAQKKARAIVLIVTRRMVLMRCERFSAAVRQR